MHGNGPTKVRRPPLSEMMQKPETSVPEIIAGLVIVAVIALTAVAYWPTDVRKGTAVAENTPPVYRAPATAPDTPRKP